MIVEAPPLRRAQAEAWHALFEVHERIPTGWALVGGQMIQALCWERGAHANRPTVDADTALDVRAHPRMLMTFTTALRDIGFEPDGTSFEGHQHRWVRGEALIDVLIPRFLGERADGRRGAGGGPRSPLPGRRAHSTDRPMSSSASKARSGPSAARRCRARSSRKPQLSRSRETTPRGTSSTSPPSERS
ncbi:hypothetical protein BC477_08400 [Clavibacter michiganensis subsp. michiganensis]|uniref:Uncharacterized protein n=1 Tax=Clavibacter michiganensis subsp. michiganensis TaxID=33013 RepID=A0A251XNG4_CLAMM|nr:hypothetical protein BC477_08400 [Clavibacter michiganensis subsp. michiganensis]OUE04743.1 hypothetical protein CMMCAS07_07330 [Clavibacter michiganensis subsp. michiganensis]